VKRVVIIGPDFAPSSYPPALRIRFFAQHLPEFGWKPTVVTIDPRYYEWAVDAENERLLPPNLEVIRTPALRARLTRKVGIGDIGLRSLWYHWRTVTRLCRSGRVDLVFISVPPYFPAVLGRLIYERFRVPYVIDYIDPWVSGSWRKLPGARHWSKRGLSGALARVLEPFALKRVGHIIGVSKGTMDGVIARYPWLAEADATEIPYGGEPADFDYLRRNSRQNRLFKPDDGLLHVSYVGACNPQMNATVRALFEAMRLGLRRTPWLFRCIRMHFVGTTYAANAEGLYQVLPLAREMGVEDFVEEHPGRVPYLDALQILLDSHALVVIGSDEPHYTASKIFPYILARRPLLAIFHEASSVVRILQETQAGRVITFSSGHPPIERMQEISECLEEILSLPRDYQPPTRWEAFEPYTARAMTARLAQAFEKALIKRL
jgi:hypothetical protein